MSVTNFWEDDFKNQIANSNLSEHLSTNELKTQLNGIGDNAVCVSRCFFARLLAAAVSMRWPTHLGVCVCLHVYFGGTPFNRSIAWRVNYAGLWWCVLSCIDDEPQHIDDHFSMAVMYSRFAATDRYVWMVRAWFTFALQTFNALWNFILVFCYKSCT